MGNKPLISIIIPIYNEAENIPQFFTALKNILDGLEKYDCEMVYVDDGSSDASVLELQKNACNQVQIVEFSRNFGKEAALSAGLKASRGDAAIMIDSDFQHPMELIPEFIAKWESGADVVIGIRKANKKAGFVKKAGSFIFYKIIKRISKIEMCQNETDFRLVSREVIDAFNKLSESNRMTRALIDWLGYKRDYVYFEANERTNGQARYSIVKLANLAINSFVSLSLLPLRLAGYLGILIMFTVGPFGLYLIMGKYIFDWAYASSFSGPAQLAFLITFLVGIVLSSLGLVALYIANIHNEVLRRPLYIVKAERRENI